MREFKFRVWNQKDKEWENPAILEVFDRSGVFRPLYEPREDYVIMQWTGGEDKNKKEIYEGDIVKVQRCYTRPFINDDVEIDYKHIEGEEEVGYILWGWATYNFLIGYRRYDDYDDFRVGHRCEVIGNVFENPELVPWYPK